MKNYPKLDGIRCVAILMVVIYHYVACIFDRSAFPVFWKYPIHIIGLWFVGVDLFFVLSGFLIGRILFKNQKSKFLIYKFYLKRALRILPAYYLILIIFFILNKLNILSSFPWFTNRDVPLHVYFYFGQNFYNAINENFGGNFLSVTWSLAIEEQFYLILPFIFRYIKIDRQKIILWVFILIAIIFRHTIGGIQSYVLLVTRMDALFIGVLIAIHFEENNPFQVISSFKKIIPLILVLLIIVFLWFSTNQHIGGDLHTIILAIIVIIFILTLTNNIPILLSKFLESSFCKFISKISFMIYLSHQIILGIMFQMINKSIPKISNLQEFLIMIFSLIITILFSTLSFYFFENKINLIGKKVEY